FFFSSRRRHTRFSRDWSSDVCSSDLAAQLSGMAQGVGYVLAAFGPLLIGVLHSITGGYAAAGWLFAFLGMATAINGWGAGRAILDRKSVVWGKRGGEGSRHRV